MAKRPRGRPRLDPARLQSPADYSYIHVHTYITTEDMDKLEQIKDAFGGVTTAEALRRLIRRHRFPEA